MPAQSVERKDGRSRDRIGFLERFPGIARAELVRLFTAVWQAHLVISHEHDHAMRLLEAEPDNDSYRIFEHLARTEATFAEDRLNTLIRELRKAPIESDDDLIAIVTFEAFSGSLGRRSPDFLKWLHRRFEDRFGDAIFDRETPAAARRTGDDDPTADGPLWDPVLAKSGGHR